ncbi:MAG: LLM class flavin-dependent oxidoreductase [Alphaproteobacteria bacterium]|nr:LLM class flavin-dependent oxidoreductase [Alphaproteobacteria bacterium]
MELDVFFSISQTPVDGRLPTEAEMFASYFRQVEAADELGYGVAWVAESHLSTEVQKGNRRPVVPHWQGEIGLNTQLPLLAAHTFQRTKRIEVGSAVMNIVCMGGPIAAAERVAAFLALHGLDPAETRRLHVGFSAGRFAFMNEASGIVPRSPLEEAAWPALRGRIFAEAAEIFVRLLRGDTLSSDDVAPTVLGREDFWIQARCAGCGATWDLPFAAREHLRCRACGGTQVAWSEPAWERVRALADGEQVAIPNRWIFETLRIVPQDWRRELLQLVVGSHDPQLQEAINRIAPVQVFNLSITRPEVIEDTHRRLAAAYHPDGGPWRRGHMPRTVMVFLDDTVEAAQARAQAALSAYWTALEGTIDPRKLAQAADNALIGDADTVAAQARARFHPDDRLMLWFDFFDHDGDRVVRGMRAFRERVAPLLEQA